MTFLAYIFSTGIVLLILIHAIYTVLRDGKRSLSSEGEVVRNLSRRRQHKTFNLKRIKKELFFRKLKYTLTFLTGAAALCAVIAVVCINVYVF